MLKTFILVFFVLLALFILFSIQRGNSKNIIVNKKQITNNLQSIVNNPISDSNDSISNKYQNQEFGKVDKKIPNLYNLQTAYLAGGCFWCIESVFQETEGVADAVSGFAGGTEVQPKYEDVAGSKTSHREAVKITFDPNIITYKDLVRLYFKQIDPTDEGGQFSDRGFGYTTAIFTTNKDQQNTATKVIKDLEKLNLYQGKSVVTKVIDFTTFYAAADYHQDFYKKSAQYYKQYEKGSGRYDYKQFINQKFIELERKDYKDKEKTDNELNL